VTASIKFVSTELSWFVAPASADVCRCSRGKVYVMMHMQIQLCIYLSWLSQVTYLTLA
jgi:hypothetical protein